ncbi:hypothetical protein EZJ19_14625 [Parasulfuritortus cantonensis]|uniref:Uncharacterized protein n=1 Tax=Parasulfuritortus cantonensis TaxID=2528202 RepID=A0A4R1B613_9PROT|nr:hypothetical protein [Parasulfuritortus cantonensis]TCJ11648.1 hypothetical protein EZJ19_14625 [Parasulfuritortus cantonensis]
MKRGKAVMSLISVPMIACLMAWAPVVSGDDTPDRPPHGPPGNPEMKAAIDACAASVARDAQGRPERKAMDACMQAKGFAPPRGGPGEHGHPPPPPRDD